MSDTQLQTLDLNDPTLILPDEELVLNPDGDAFAGLAPVDDGEHVAVLTFGQRGTQLGTTKDGRKYIMAHLQATIEEGTKKFVVFDTVSTLVQESSGTSRMAGVLKAAGETVPARISIGDLARQFAQFVAGSPRVLITTRWEAQYQLPPENGASKGKYKTFLRGQRKFPENGNGGLVSEVKAPDGTLVRAQAVITKYAPVQG
jgi:hypothetical protein